jgi:hypothetical protein
MVHVLYTLFAINSIALLLTASLGLILSPGDSAVHHLTSGLATAILVCFTHLLLLFYLIGTEGDIKEALEPYPELAARFVPEVKRLKFRAFPAGCFAALLMITAALAGGEIHSRLLVAAGRDGPLPYRGVSAWWVHGALVLLAWGVHVFAMFRAIEAARGNRTLIAEINVLLAAAADTPKDPDRPAVEPLAASGPLSGA